ncbi:hypothetical protein SAMN04490244_10467 [Tranquillimonas rosea]|uniref:Uncharacterized protein n=1 Tax=Tranquillimonas rosea TaxID=641238 RepID=A0A1H9TB10_9RHOB|nr:hypothetical protein [Tranquillimonas rosea]SER94341.1 hypothetical protein SAMN04490244_10467 [Tranquillimonas rosea]
MHTVSINEPESSYLELFRIALSAEDHEARIAALRQVKQVVSAERLRVLSQSDCWTDEPDNQALLTWAARTAAEREDAICEFLRVSRVYEDRNERRLTIAEHAGKLVYLSIKEEKREGVQTPSGILYQLTQAAKEHGIQGGRDKDTVRRSWGAYRGIVHLGMAIDLCDEQASPPEEVLFLAEQIRRVLSTSCPKGASEPYVPQAEQISFVYKSGIWGPRFRDRGLPYRVED